MTPPPGDDLPPPTTNLIQEPVADAKPDASQYFAGAVMMFFVVVVDGFVVSTLWRWFAVPMGVPRITLGAGMAASLLRAYFAAKRKNDGDRRTTADMALGARASLTRAISSGLFVLAFASLARLLT